MLDLLERTYLSVFRRYPMLARLALVVLLGEVVVASINNFGIAFYVNGDLHQPMRTVGVLISTFLIAEMLLKLPAGHLSDRYGRRHFASVGIAASVGTALALAALPSALLIATPALIYLALLPLRVLDGAGSAALWPPLFASVPDHVPSEERGVAMSVINTAYLAGLALGPAFAGTAMKLARVAGHGEAAGKAPFVMAALFAVVGALVAWRLPAHGRAIPAAAPATRSGGLPPLRITLIVILITFCNMFATATLAPLIAPYVSQVGHVHRSDVGLLLLALLVPTAGFGMPLGHLADRWPKYRVVQLSLCIAAVGMWAVPHAHALPGMIGAGIVVTLGFMLGLPSWLALIADMAPEGSSGKVMGLMATAQGLGAFAGPLLGGVLWDVSVRAPFYVAAGLLTDSALVAVVLLGGLTQYRRVLTPCALAAAALIWIPVLAAVRGPGVAVTARALRAARSGDRVALERCLLDPADNPILLHLLDQKRLDGLKWQITRPKVKGSPADNWELVTVRFTPPIREADGSTCCDGLSVIVTLDTAQARAAAKIPTRGSGIPEPTGRWMIVSTDRGPPR